MLLVVLLVVLCHVVLCCVVSCCVVLCCVLQNLVDLGTPVYTLRHANCDAVRYTTSPPMTTQHDTTPQHNTQINILLLSAFFCYYYYYNNLSPLLSTLEVTGYQDFLQGPGPAGQGARGKPPPIQEGVVK